MKSVKLFLALISMIVSAQLMAADLPAAGRLGPVRVVSASVMKVATFDNIGISAYNVYAIVESSNSCMVPIAFVADSANHSAITLSGVYAQGGCSGEFDPVTTEVLVGELTLSKSVTPQVSVNGVVAELK